MFAGLFLSAALLGLVGGIHCVGMCGAVGGALCGGATKPTFRWWNVARLGSYAVAGAAVGGGAQGVLTMAARWPAMQAAWVMLQFAALAVALVMLFAPRAAGWSGLAGNTGWMPVTLGHVAQMGNRQRLQGAAQVQPLFRARSMPSAWGAFTGLLWAGFPCGLLHGALLMAWMSGSAAAGAFVMVLFGSASAAWLLGGAGLMKRLKASGLWTETRLRRLTGAVLLVSWLAMAVGMTAGTAGGWAGESGGPSGMVGLNGLFCRPGP